MRSNWKKIDQSEENITHFVDLWSQDTARFDLLLGLQERIDYQFRKKILLFECLTHRSAVVSYNQWRRKNQQQVLDLPWNERLEFLGDSVLSLVISTVLWSKDPNYTEGQLSKIRSHLVCENVLCQIARDLGLAQIILLGKGELKSGGLERKALLADCLEALIGAIYLDSDFSQACVFVKKIYYPYLKEGATLAQALDHKSKLQEYYQEHKKVTPNYQVLKSSGPDHRKTFQVGVYLKDKQLATGWGKTKKEASKEAASNAMSGLGQNKALSNDTQNLERSSR